jgi:hypothetical protein
MNTCQFVLPEAASDSWLRSELGVSSMDLEEEGNEFRASRSLGIF